MLRYVLGLYGAVNSGKSSFLKSLSGHDIDILSEEQRLGITINNNAGFVKYNSKDSSFYPEAKDVPHDVMFQLLDNPGHAAYIYNTASTLNMLDIPMLVVGADVESLEVVTHYARIFKILKYDTICIIITKIDVVEKSKTKELYKQIDDLLKENFKMYFIIPYCKYRYELSYPGLVLLFKYMIEKTKVKIKPYAADILRAYNPNRPGTKVESLQGVVLGGRYYTQVSDEYTYTYKNTQTINLTLEPLNGINTISTDMFFGLGVNNYGGHSIIHKHCKTTNKLKYNLKLKNVKKITILAVIGTLIVNGKLDNDKQEITLVDKIPVIACFNPVIILKQIAGGYKISYIINIQNGFE